MPNDIGLAGYGGGQARQRKCSVEECEGKHYSLGLCKRHYLRLKRHNSPLVCVHNADRKHVRLSDEKVLEIRKMRQAGLTLKTIADQFDVHTSTVHLAANGRTWPEVKRQ